MRTLFLTLSFLVANGLFAQSNITVGAAAPEINITNWLANVPVDKSLKGKYIVLEFWATWCGPCLAAVPHMNQLQREFGGGNIRFVSITDEPVARTTATLNRIKFSSLVVTDETKQTQIAFGDGVNGLEQFPLTVLIDRDNIVRWIGEPEELTASLMRDFLADQPVGYEDAITGKNGAASAEEEAVMDGIEYYLSLAKDGTIDWKLDITEREDGPASGSMTMKGMGFYEEGITIKDLYRKIYPNHQVTVDSTIANRAYTVNFIDRYPDVDSDDRLARGITEELGLEMETGEGTVPNYTIRIQTPGKLDLVTGGFSSASDVSPTKMVITGFTLASLAEKLQERSELNWSFKGEDEKSYAYMIDFTSVETIKNSLAEYGLHVAEGEQQVVTLHVKER